MNDNSLRGEQWRNLVATYFAPILGGTKEEWARANHEAMTGIQEASAWNNRLNSAHDYESFEREYYLDWLDFMCDKVGVAAPSPERSIELGRASSAWIIPQIRAAYPGAVEAIRTLHDQGYHLYTASGECSSDLAAYLTGMGVVDCFQRLYGPDLIDTFKTGPAFYERLLADAGVDPADALIVDDSHHAIAWAAEARVRSVLVGSPNAEEPPHLVASIGSLAELPAIIDGLV